MEQTQNIQYSKKVTVPSDGLHIHINDYILSSYETRNVCITSNDITECVAEGNCNSMYDLN